jgi:hypothetical protein
MKVQKDAPKLDLTDDQLTELKKAIADLAEAKRVSLDMLGADEFIGAELQPTIDNSPLPSQHFLWRNKWPLASGVVGIILGFLLATVV